MNQNVTINAAKIKNTVTAKLRRNPKAALIGSIITAAASVVAWITRFAVHAEMKSIQSSYAARVIVGSEQMTRTEYLEYAAGVISNCTAVAVVFLIAAAVLFAYCCKQNKQTAQ